MNSSMSHLVRLLLPALFLALQVITAHAQLNEHCTVSILNRTARVRPDGRWRIDNVPANFGRVRARATCVENGVTRTGQSDLFTIRQDTTAGFNADISLATIDPIPASLALTAPATTLTTAGATAQLTVTATLPDGNTRDATTRSSGTSYTTSNRAVATVSPDGLVMAVASGTVVISALNEGALGLIRIRVALTGGDTDNDGIPDDVELANGLDPNDPADAQRDLDADGLVNRQELIDYNTNPRVPDTDGDGVRDGLEVQTGSNPLDPTSVNLQQVLTSIEISPISFSLIFNTIIGEASRQLTVTGRLRDGTTIDLTSTATGTNYTSSDLAVCNFGIAGGRVLAGSDGTCTVTASNSGFSAQATGTVTTFAPVALSSIPIPGYANNVDVGGNFAYVAAGAAGLQVVDVSDPRTPVIVGSRDTPGNANDVRVVGDLAYVADGAAGLQIIDVSDPTNPVIVGAMDTPGEAQDVMVSGVRAYVADGDFGLQIVDTSNPAAPNILGSVDTPGTARGVAVSGDLAVVADDEPASTVQIIDVTNPANPQVVGSVDIPLQTKDVAVRNNLAYVAAFFSGFQIVDLSVPASPRIIGSDPSNFAPRDIELSGGFALAASAFFRNAVPITDISDPTNPLFRAIVDFSPLLGLEENVVGTGIALTQQYVYLTGELFGGRQDNGVLGDTVLYIGQYLSLPEDTAGMPPAVRITSPVSGDTAVEGTTIPVTVDATDDIAVVSVDFLVNGQVVSTGVSRFNLKVPAGVTSLTLGARAIDPGGNVGTAADVVVNVAPDSEPPTVRITSPVPGETVRERAVLPITVDAADNLAVMSVDFLVNGQTVFTATTAPYRFNFTVPLGVTSLTVGARATDLNGNIGFADDIVVNVVPDHPPTAEITAPTLGETAIARATVAVLVRATDDVAVAAVDFLVNGEVVFTDTTAPYQFNFRVPQGISGVTSGAVAIDSQGQVGVATDVAINVTPDPETAAVGRVLDENGNPVAKATIACMGVSGVTGLDGTFSLSGLPTVRGDIRCKVTTVTADGTRLGGASQVVVPVQGGTTDLGTLVAREGPLYPGPKFAVGREPESVVVADLNQDGNLDLATANSRSDNVSVLLSNGDGTFQAQRTYRATSGPDSITTADLNGDTIPDLVTANGFTDRASVFLGNGDGTFRAEQRFVVGDFPTAIAAADVNRDGFADLVTANSSSDDVSVLLGNGNGTFQTQRRFAAGDGARSLAVTDLNRDGLLDLAVVNTFSGDVLILLGNGDGTFQPQSRFAVGFQPRSLVAVELNRDGIQDLVAPVSDFYNNVSAVLVFLGNGDGTFQTPQASPVEGFPETVAAADLNGDTTPDLVAAGGFAETSVLLGIGDGTFQPLQLLIANRAPAAVAVGDMDADGNPDVVTANRDSGDVSVLFGTGGGVFESAQLYAAGRFPIAVATADLNADGAPDVVTANRDSGDLSVLLGNGDGTFEGQQQFTQAGAPTSVTITDVNHDGIPDLAGTKASSNELVVLLGTGYGTFSRQQRFATGIGPEAVTAEDFNADGNPDLAAANRGSGDVSVLLGSRDGAFGTQQRFVAGNEPVSITGADLNRDGVVDLVTANRSSEDVSVLLGNGDGTFQSQRRFAVGDVPESVAAADLNGDSIPDLAVASPFSDHLSILLGSGDGTFRVQQRVATGSSLGAMIVEDLNSDDIPDLVVTRSFSLDISVFFGNGDGTFGAEQRFGAGGLPVAVGDFDVDGTPDLVTAGSFLDRVSVLLHR